MVGKWRNWQYSSRPIFLSRSWVYMVAQRKLTEKEADAEGWQYEVLSGAYTGSAFIYFSTCKFYSFFVCFSFSVSEWLFPPCSSTSFLLLCLNTFSLSVRRSLVSLASFAPTGSTNLPPLVPSSPSPSIPPPGDSFKPEWKWRASILHLFNLHTSLAQFANIQVASLMDPLSTVKAQIYICIYIFYVYVRRGEEEAEKERLWGFAGAVLHQSGWLMAQQPRTE